MICPAGTIAQREQAERHIAMCRARAVWLPMCAAGAKAEDTPAHGVWQRAWDAWAAHASNADRAAEYAATYAALHDLTAKEKVS